MAKNPLEGHTNRFDGLLKQRGGWFDAQLEESAGRGIAIPPGGGAASPSPGAPIAAPVKPGATPGALPAPALPVFQPETSEAVRRLNDRFGEGWRYEVVENREEQGEVIVLCKVSVPEKQISKTQFGSAPSGARGGTAEIRGTADGVPFVIAGAAADPARPGISSDAAFRQAVENALAKCADML